MQKAEAYEKLLYVMLIERGKTCNRINKAAVERHVNHIRNLDDSDKLELCGASKGLPGIDGMVILKAPSYEEAEEICRAEPLVVEGYAAYKFFTLKVGNRENNYLL